MGSCGGSGSVGLPCLLSFQESLFLPGLGFTAGLSQELPGAELFPEDPPWLSRHTLPGVLVHLLLCVSGGGLGAVRQTVRASVLLPTFPGC